VTTRTVEPSVAFDFDGTLVQASGDQRFMDYLEEQGITCNRPLFQRTGNWHTSTNMNNDELSIHYTSFQLSPHYQFVHVMPGAKFAIITLFEYFALHIVTSRGKKTAHVTEKEIKSHFGEAFSSTTFNTEGIKAAAVKGLNAFTYVENSIDHATQVAEVASVILMPTPHRNGQRIDPRLILPEAHQHVTDDMEDDNWREVWFKTWLEIPHLICELYKKKNQTQVLVP
jgi:hypothetical protein